MNSTKNTHYFVIALLAIVWLTGCESRQNVEPELESEVAMTNEEVALSVASILGINSGGVMDQWGDVLELASTDAHAAMSKPDATENRSATYDSLTQTWTVDVDRESGDPAAPPYHLFHRTFTHQFLNKNGLAQKRYLTGADTAYSIPVTIVSGEGRHITPRISQRLTSISGEWLAVNTQTPEVTASGTFSRSAVDTLTTERGVRYAEHGIALSLNSITGPRGSRRNLSEKTAGTITGTYTAAVTIEKERVTIHKTVEKEIFIDLSSGETTITVSDETFTIDPVSGDLVSY